MRFLMSLIALSAMFIVLREHGSEQAAMALTIAAAGVSTVLFGLARS